MSNELFLIDFENVPGVNLTQIDVACRVIVFTGANQKAIPLAIVAAAQRFGARLEWRRVDANGPNALDFFIACELGRILASAADTHCTVLSNDKGFDPLLRHLNAAGLRCKRVGIQAIAKSKPSTAPAPKPEPVVDPAHFKRVIELLGKSEKKTRPRKHKTLVQAISSYFQKKLSNAQVEGIITKLLRDKKITENAGAITYSF